MVVVDLEDDKKVRDLVACKYNVKQRRMEGVVFVKNVKGVRKDTMLGKQFIFYCTPDAPEYRSYLKSNRPGDFIKLAQIRYMDYQDGNPHDTSIESAILGR